MGLRLRQRRKGRFDVRQTPSLRLVFRCGLDPLEGGIGDLLVVLVSHDHVVVATDAEFRRVEHFGPPAGGLDPGDRCLAIIIPGPPGEMVPVATSRVPRR